MSNVDNSKAGPSKPKKAKMKYKSPRALIPEEVLEVVYASDDSDWEFVHDSSDSGSDDELDKEHNCNNQDGDELARGGADGNVNSSDHGTIAQIQTQNWQDIATGMKTFGFLKNNELLVDTPENAEPYYYFRLLLDEDFLQNIVDETNRYAVEVLILSASTSRSRISSWKELTVEELLIFIGLIFHTGTIRLNRLQDYWKTHRLFNLQCFSNHMSRDRFLIILRCLHFSRNPEEGAPIPEDRLYKIRSAIDYFNKKMSETYYPDKNLSLDESMVLWKGRIIFKQYVKNKHHKYGIKLYMLTEPNGLVLNMAVYTGQFDEVAGKGHAEKVVFHLTEEKLNQGHSLFMDSYYNSYQLAKNLLNKSTYCTGTLRADRKGAPKDVVCAKLKPGETKAKYLDGVLVGRWKDKKEVTYISTEFTNDMVNVQNKRGQKKEKPLPIVQYNSNMCGTARQDQMMDYYPCSCNTLRWYKKLGIHIFHLLLFNSYILYNKYSSGKKLSYYDYRLEILEKLLPDKGKKLHKKTNDGDVHLPEKIESLNAKGKTLRKRCRMCTQKNIRKDSIYHCTKCPGSPGLCLQDCFKKYHEKK